MNPVTLTGALSDRDGWSAEDCSLATALDVIGRRASMLLLRESFYGAHRFEEFARRTGLSEAITAARLKELLEEGVLERRPYHEPGRRRREDYHLTEKGRALLPAIVALMQWADRWARPGGGPIELSHSQCGAPIHAELRCARGHAVADGTVQATVRRRAASGNGSWRALTGKRRRGT